MTPNDPADPVKAVEDRFRALVENSFDAIFLVDSQGRITYASPSNARVLGYRPEELVGRTGFDLVHPDKLELAHGVFAETLAAPGRHVPFNCRARHRDGSWRDLEGVCQNRLGDPVIEAIIVNYRDVTERRRVEAELRFRTALLECQTETVKDGLLLVSADRQWLSWNKRFLKMWGIPQDMAQNSSRQAALKIVAEQLVDPRPFLAQVEHLNEHPDQSSQDVMLLKDGRTIARYSGPVRSAQGVYYGRIWFFRDVSRRRRAEAALRESEERFRGFMDNNPAIAWLKDEDGRYVYVNRRFEEHFHVRLKDWLGKTDFDFWPEETAQQFRGHDLAVLGSGTAQELQETTPDLDGGIHSWWVFKFPFHDTAGRRYVGGIGVDVTERLRAEAAQQDSDERYRLITENATELIWLTDVEGRIVYNSPAVRQMMGYDPMQKVGMSSLANVHPEDVPRAREALGRVLAGEEVRLTLRCRHADGSWRWLETSATLMERQGQRYLLGVCRDVTERLHAEQALRDSEKRFRDLFESSPDAIFVEDLSGIVLDVNPAACRLHDMDRAGLVGKNALDLTPPDHREETRRIRTRMVQGDLTHYEGFGLTKRGRAVPIEVRASPINYSGTPALLLHVRDLTERKQLEEQYRQAQKMEAVGRLAGGVAHDFNNLLTVISGYTAIMLEGLPAESPLRLDLEQIQIAGERAAAVTRQLLAFGRKQMLRPVVLDLNAVVARMQQLLHRLIGEDVHLATNLAPALPRVLADPTQLEQVVLNLAVNARDAMPDGGRLTIATSALVVDDTTDRKRPELHPGCFAVLTVTDTGCGMDAATLAHVFEPFFTTKEIGKGTGLGLATVYGIIRQSGGHIFAASEMDHGSTFEVYLPGVAEPLPPAVVAEPAALPRGREIVLLVEDEPAVRDVARRVLQAQGYTVLDAPDGARALQVDSRHPGPIHLLVTDVVMPGMNGRELARRLVERRPELKVLYLSGYADSAVLRRGISEGSAAFLQKPFLPDVLARKVREVLEGQVRSEQPA